MAEETAPKALRILELVVLILIILVALSLSFPDFFEKERQVYSIPGMIEAESLTVKAKGQNVFFQRQETKGFSGRWTGDSHMFGMAYVVGDWVEWMLPAKPPGRYQLSVYMTKSNDYGTVQFFVDGKKLGSPIDLWNENSVVPTGKIPVGDFDIGTKASVLRLEIVGKNSANSQPHFYFGIDGIALEKK